MLIASQTFSAGSKDIRSNSFFITCLQPNSHYVLGYHYLFGYTSMFHWYCTSAQILLNLALADAEVAELVDALDSGSSGRKAVGVQVPSSAPPSLSPRETDWEARKTNRHT
jgi:hypothetical protein